MKWHVTDIKAHVALDIQQSVVRHTAGALPTFSIICSRKTFLELLFLTGFDCWAIYRRGLRPLKMLRILCPPQWKKVADPMQSSLPGPHPLSFVLVGQLAEPQNVLGWSVLLIVCVGQSYEKYW